MYPQVKHIYGNMEIEMIQRRCCGSEYQLCFAAATNKETTLMTERSDRLRGPGWKLTSPPSNLWQGDKCRNYSHAWVFFWTCFNFAVHTMNQTAAEAINKDRHYGNESVELVRSPSLRMLSHDSGQGFSVTWVIDGSIKGRGAELAYPICHTQACAGKEGKESLWA